jgi:hypothetical protein
MTLSRKWPATNNNNNNNNHKNNDNDNKKTNNGFLDHGKRCTMVLKGHSNFSLHAILNKNIVSHNKLPATSNHIYNKFLHTNHYFTINSKNSNVIVHFVSDQRGHIHIISLILTVCTFIIMLFESILFWTYIYFLHS